MPAKAHASLKLHRQAERHGELRYEPHNGATAGRCFSALVRNKVQSNNAKGFSRGRVAKLARGVYVRASGQDCRQVVIKARLAKACNYKSQQHFYAAQLKQLGYLERDGAGVAGKAAELFGSEKPLQRLEFAKLCAGDRHVFHFIVAPEHGSAINLKSYTQALLLQMEQDLATRLQWCAVAHHNTAHPHVHLMLRGVDEQGKDLIIRPRYLSQGLRYRAQQQLTRILGPKPEQEIWQAQLKRMQQARVLDIDKWLVKQRSAGGKLALDELIRSGSGFKPELIKRRVEYYQQQGWAVALGPTRFQLRKNILQELGTKHITRDRCKYMAQHYRSDSVSLDYCL